MAPLQLEQRVRCIEGDFSWTFATLFGEIVFMAWL